MAVQKFCLKVPVFEAVQFIGGNFDEIEKFVGGDAEFRSGQLVVATREGPLRASNSDWIIKDGHGKFSTCRHDLFDQLCELAGQ